VVVGAGYIGLEVAEGLLARGLTVTVIEKNDVPMGAVLDADMAAAVADAMRSAGVDLRLGTAVTGFTAADGHVTAVETEAGAVETDLVIIGLGVRANVDLARDAGISVGEAGGIVVDDYLRTSVPHVWAAGDCVESHHRITGRRMRIKIVAARGTGRLLGAQIVGGEDAGKRIDVLATALWNGMTVQEVGGMDLSYAPPFSPVWDPVLLAAGKAASAV
jgi:NADPH-dependent 2,4-dienoyl-CoA reductase/sulfur reductase-like enzyme